jgi:hypothetical protein
LTLASTGAHAAGERGASDLTEWSRSVSLRRATLGDLLIKMNTGTGKTAVGAAPALGGKRCQNSPGSPRMAVT